MEVSKYFYLLALLFVLVQYVASHETICGPAKTLGVTYPPGDIIVHQKDPLEIYCTLKEQPKISSTNPLNKHYNASDLFFMIDRDPFPNDYIYPVNETTIKLRVDKPPQWKTMIQCALRLADENTRLVCLNYVMVGEKPQELSNFSCISHNWESLNCSWTRQPNNVPTNYTVSYALNKKNMRFHPCPDSTIDRDYCVWNSSSYPPYRLPYPSYHFFIRGENAFGKVFQNITIDHYASVIPSKPVNLSVIGSTSESLEITWAVPVAVHNFPPGLHHKIMYQSKYDSIGTWQTVIPQLPDPKGVVLKYNITGLKYAHALYDVRVLLKSATADESKWSEPATTTFHTNSTVPGAPPKTCPGGFEIRSPSAAYRDIYIYWQQIPKYLENGDNFEYKITEVIMHGFHGPEQISLMPTVVTKTYALFSHMLSYHYDFTIVSSNNKGYSKSSSTVTVPAKEDSLPEPSDFVKSSYDGGIWEINWKVDPSVSSYTIFWCDNKQDRPYECQGFLNWTHVIVSEDTKEDTAGINITLPDKLYQIALSANTNTSSSGMIWASCTLLSGNVYSKLKEFEIFPGSDFIDVNWTFDCVKPMKTNGRGFQLHYCPIKDPEKKPPSCKEPEKIIPIKGNAGNSHVRIRGLKPYTTYSVYFARTNQIQLKEPLLGTTLEAAPDQPPQNLRAVQVTNTSITLTWKQPSSINGILKNYYVYWNNNYTVVTDKSPTVQMTLTNLKSYWEYYIKVQACTTNCSANSSAIDIKTGIGIPGIIESSPTVRLIEINDTDYSMEAKWFPPKEPGGPIECYDVRVKLSDGSSIQKETLYNTPNTSLLMPARECPDIGGAKYYKVQVRAVNFDSAGNKLRGPWSIEGEGNCVPVLPNLALMVFVFAVGILALLAICISVVYVIRCLWLRCKAMQNVSVKLPPQLELSNVFPSKNKGAMDQLASHTCPPQLKQLDAKGASPPDQQLLLDQKDKEESLESSPEDCEEGHGDQESSGCGSGHDSVSSSITAGTHITDSGTEADEVPQFQMDLPPSTSKTGQRKRQAPVAQEPAKRPSTPDVFGDTPRRKDESRQRNVSSSGSNGEGYSRLAPAPSANGGYVTVAPASRGYVSHPPLWSSQNQPKGYVTVGPPVNMNSTCG